MVKRDLFKFQGTEHVQVIGQDTVENIEDHGLTVSIRTGEHGYLVLIKRNAVIEQAKQLPDFKSDQFQINILILSGPETGPGKVFFF